MLKTDKLIAQEVYVERLHAKNMDNFYTIEDIDQLITKTNQETEIKIEDAKSINAILSNEFQSIPTDPNGNNGLYETCFTSIQVFNGSEDVTEECQYQVQASENVVGRWDVFTKTFFVTDLLSDAENIQFTIQYKNVSMEKIFSVSKNKQGIPGSLVDSYHLELNTEVILRSDRYNPPSILMKSWHQGVDDLSYESPAWFVIYESTDGDTYQEPIYQSIIQETTYEHVLTTPNIKLLKIQCYQDQEKQKLIDQQTIPVLYDAEQKINDIEANKMYRLEIRSSNGNIFKNNNINTVLSAAVYSWDENVTDTLDDNMFVWTRVSNDPEGDILWNQRNYGGTKSIAITKEDVHVRATFFCDLIDTTTRQSLLY